MISVRLDIVQAGYLTSTTPQKLNRTANTFETVILSEGSEGKTPDRSKVNTHDDAD